MKPPPPPGSPTGPICRELPVSRAFFYMSLKFPNKSSPDRKISPFSLIPWERSTPPCSPKWVPYGKRHPFSKTLFNISFRVPSKRALPPVYPHTAPTERDAPFPEPSICLSKSLVNEPSSRSPKGPIWRSPFPEPPFTYPSQSPLK